LSPLRGRPGKIVQANLAIGSLLKDKDMLTADLEASRAVNKAKDNEIAEKDSEIAALRDELARREAQITKMSMLFDKGLEMCREGAGTSSSEIRN
jgi:hypothetical protein